MAKNDCSILYFYKSIQRGSIIKTKSAIFIILLLVIGNYYYFDNFNQTLRIIVILITLMSFFDLLLKANHLNIQIEQF